MKYAATHLVPWMLLLLAHGAAAADEEKKPAPAAPVDVPGFWTPDELRRIDQGLEVLNVTRKDLGFQKRPIEDPFRLTVVNRILDDPLAIGPVAAEWDAVARRGLPSLYQETTGEAADPVALLWHAARSLDRRVTESLGGATCITGFPRSRTSCLERPRARFADSL